MIGEARFSECKTWRYSLTRTWARQANQCVWVCLNPSTADADQDDPTVRKITGFSARWGYGGFTLFNVLALRSTDPRGLLTHFNPRGPDNEPWRIAEAAKKLSPHPAIIAWGAIHKKFRKDALEVVRALQIARCLGYTKDGFPRHPLMLPYSTKLQDTDPSHWLGELATL